MTTIFTHPAVEKYLTDLDVALAHASTDHADDLRDQVREHLADALSPDATDAQVDVELDQLGPPHLWADDPPIAERTPAYTLPSLAGWIRQRSLRFWAAITAIVLVAGTAAVLVTIQIHVAKLESTCNPCTYLFDEDRLHMIDAPPTDQDQMIVPARFGQDQAVVFSLYNPSRFTQTVRGGILSPPGLTLEPISLEIATVPTRGEDTNDQWPRGFTTGKVAIAPHTVQVVVVHWVHNICEFPGDVRGWVRCTYRLRPPGGHGPRASTSLSFSPSVGESQVVVTDNLATGRFA